MFDNTPKPLNYAIMGATGLHIILGFVAAMQNCPLRELGFFFTVMGILALISVVWAGMIKPWMTFATLAIILIPGILIGLLTRAVLYGWLLLLFIAPIQFLLAAADFLAANYFMFLFI